MCECLLWRCGRSRVPQRGCASSDVTGIASPAGLVASGVRCGCGAGAVRRPPRPGGRPGIRKRHWMISYLSRVLSAPPAPGRVRVARRLVCVTFNHPYAVSVTPSAVDGTMADGLILGVASRAARVRRRPSPSPRRRRATGRKSPPHPTHESRRVKTAIHIYNAHRDRQVRVCVSGGPRHPGCRTRDTRATPPGSTKS